MGKSDANVTTKSWADIAAGAEQPKERGGEETQDRIEQHEASLGSMYEHKTAEKRREQPGNAKPGGGNMEQANEATQEIACTLHMIEDEIVQRAEVRPEIEVQIDQEKKKEKKKSGKDN
jgi:hypothetical protein